MLKFVEEVLENMPSDWLALTTHRLDIYDESLAKTKFLDELEALFDAGDATRASLENLPTAYDYIRLGHPLSCLLEWAIARLNDVDASQVISFSSKTMPVLAILRRNHLENVATRLLHSGGLPACFDPEVLRRVYGYNFVLEDVGVVGGGEAPVVSAFDGKTIFVSEQRDIGASDLNPNVDFVVNLHSHLGSVVIINGKENAPYVSEIQHVRRRESIAMTPANSVAALSARFDDEDAGAIEANRTAVVKAISKITGAKTEALLGSCGLSVQYAIMMGVVHDALENHPGKAVKLVVPPNCYGGTNDQARRVAACVENVEVVDLLVDGDNEMVASIDSLLNKIAHDDAVPCIIAEIPTNPRVEVPDLAKLKDVLSQARQTQKGADAIGPIFVLDQTFCPNVLFFEDDGPLSAVRAISYVSGSKFPSGGRCTAGYCVANQNAESLLETVGVHLRLCDNEATGHQVEVLAEQMPSMNERIRAAYENTREFVDFIQTTLPSAKINFVSQDLAQDGFTPSVFSLELPATGATHAEREALRRELNLRLINAMIHEIPDESKFCVSYGQLSGCYWTIPATSTQGTTKESDKDYIVRVSLSPRVNIDRHKEVFAQFASTL